MPKVQDMKLRLSKTYNHLLQLHALHSARGIIRMPLIVPTSLMLPCADVFPVSLLDLAKD